MLELSNTIHNDFISLFQLNKLIQESLKIKLNMPFWVKAEIAQAKENYSGHCYLELVEKDPLTNKIIAQSKGTIWAGTYRMLKPYFETTTGRKLTEGLKILICVKVEFHEVYGLSLNISDIDPSYTVGDLALKKAEIVKRLKEEGVFDINHELLLPLAPQRIAVISSETAAGYTDFISHLKDNTFNFRFDVTLFPAFMQGDKSEESIVNALERVNEKINNFDVVTIIRGGGSQTDLSCFDSYWVSLNVAQFPIPVLSGIGHEQDDSVVDMVAHTRLKTPTAVADFLIKCLADFERTLDDFSSLTAELTSKSISEYKSILENALLILPLIFKERIHKEFSTLNLFSHQTSKTIEKKIQSRYYNCKMSIQKVLVLLKHKLSNKKMELKLKTSSLKSMIQIKIENFNSVINKYDKIANLVNPENILKKGFSITYFNNIPLKDTSLLSDKETITTQLFRGKIISTVISTKNRK
jgi:exodeoxyribonuclease VII large subunit